MLIRVLNAKDRSNKNQHENAMEYKHLAVVGLVLFN